MGARRRQAGQNDAGQGRGQGHVHGLVRRHALAGQQPDQGRHQHQAAADAQKAGQHAGQRAQGQVNRPGGDHADATRDGSGDSGGMG